MDLGNVTREEVLACYRMFLKREPESEQVILQKMVAEPDLWGMISHFFTCEEALRWQVTAASGYIDQHQSSLGVDVHISPANAEEMIRRTESVWSRFGREDAYFSVLTNQQYKSELITEADIIEFYQSGATGVAFFKSVLLRNGIVFNPDWCVADLGCGVGRIGEHLAKICSHYIGIDLSVPHLRIAEDLFASRGIENATFMRLNDFIESRTRFDVFYSILVLQHNPPPIMYKLLDELLSRLNEGGVAYFQLPCFLFNYSFDVETYLANGSAVGGMEMHALPQKYIFELFEKHGITLIEVTPNAGIGPIGISYSFLAMKRARDESSQKAAEPAAIGVPEPR
jgi:SAM-dependent methyltransferase